MASKSWLICYRSISDRIEKSINKLSVDKRSHRKAFTRLPVDKILIVLKIFAVQLEDTFLHIMFSVHSTWFFQLFVIRAIKTFKVYFSFAFVNTSFNLFSNYGNFYDNAAQYNDKSRKLGNLKFRRPMRYASDGKRFSPLSRFQSLLRETLINADISSKPLLHIKPRRKFLAVWDASI